MAKWNDDVVDILIDLAKTQPALAKAIRLSIQQIEKHPARIGQLILQGRYVYTDPQRRFRISYNFHPESHEIEIVVLHLF